MDRIESSTIFLRIEKSSARYNEEGLVCIQISSKEDFGNLPIPIVVVGRFLVPNLQQYAKFKSTVER